MFSVLVLVATLVSAFSAQSEVAAAELHVSDEDAHTLMKENALLSERLSNLESALATAAREKRSDDTDPMVAVAAQQAQKLSALEARLQSAENKMTSQGSTFIRWGRTVCPSGTNTVYTGVAGGSNFDEEGGASNRLCLSHNAEFDNAAPLGQYHTILRGSEYYIPGHDHTDVPCVLCWTPHTSTIMVPGTKSCPQGWTSQYTGHITAAHYAYHANSEFQCLDVSPEDIEGSARVIDDGVYFMYTTAACGTLPCPPYVDGKVITCVLCSK